MAFDSLSDKLQNIFKKLRGKGRLSEDDVKAAMKEVKMVVEGVYSAKAAIKLAEKYNVSIPIIEQVNKVLFENNGQDIDLCPEIQIKCAESMSMEMKKSIAEFMFTKLSASYETCYDVLGISNAKTEAIRRTKEEKAGFNEIFKPHESYFTQTGSGNGANNGDSNDKTAGRPSGEDTHKKQYDKTRNEVKNKGGG